MTLWPLGDSDHSFFDIWRKYCENNHRLISSLFPWHTIAALFCYWHWFHIYMHLFMFLLNKNVVFSVLLYKRIKLCLWKRVRHTWHHQTVWLLNKWMLLFICNKSPQCYSHICLLTMLIDWWFTWLITWWPQECYLKLFLHLFIMEIITMCEIKTRTENNKYM